METFSEQYSFFTPIDQERVSDWIQDTGLTVIKQIHQYSKIQQGSTAMLLHTDRGGD